MTLERLIQLLDRAAGVDEWIATETRTRRAAGEAGTRRSRRTADAVELGAVVFRDTERGRGVDRLSVDAEGVDQARLRALIDGAAERAAHALGPSWALPAPAAPARVIVADPDVATDAAGVVDQALAQLAKADGRLASIAASRIAATSRSHQAETSRGFASQYRATAVDFDIAAGPLAGPARGRLERVTGRVRSTTQLYLHRRVADAARTAAARLDARPLEPGRYDLLLRPAAIAGPLAELDPTSGPAGFGWFEPFVAQARGEWVRLGISRYRPGQPVFARTGDPLESERTAPEPAGDPITLASDGTIALAPLSAPFGDLGEPVRRFELLRAGAAAGLSLDYREAALARSTPNGGVRNLVLAPGPTREKALAEAGRARLLEVDELAWIDVDPRSGTLSAGIRGGRIHTTAAPIRVTGGVLVDNVYTLLSRARLSAEVRALGWYRGPAAIRIDGVNVTGP